MSLEQAAKHLASHGRGPDTELVHMTKGEINSLQTLAKANGGSLTINPHTGLPEAGFLSNILPTVIGGAAMYFSGGTINPATVGMITGGLQYARTGSLNKGLMAGLGAYGGAGLAGGLMGAGSASIGSQATQAAGYTPEIASGTPLSEIQGLQQTAVQNAGPSGVFGEGAKAAIANPSQTAGLMGGWGNTAKYGLAAAAPMLMQTTTQQPQITGDNVMPQRLQYNAGRPTDAQGNTVTPMPDVPTYGSGMGQNFGRERNYFPNAGYQNITPEQAKQIRGYAGGGPVEAMSNANAVGANTGFPMADINKPAYATPWQTPVSQNVVQGSADTGVNSMTGEQNEFAKGGVTSNPDVSDYGDQGQNFGAERIYASTTGLPKLMSPVAESLGYEGYKKIPEYGSSDTPKSAPDDYARPSGQTPLEALASDAVAYSKAFGGALPGGLVAGAVGNAYRDYRANDAALNGGHSGTYTGDWSGGIGNTMTEAQTQAAIAGTGGGPLSGEAWGGGPTSSESTSTSDSDGEANGGLAPHFPRHMARGGLSAAASHLGDYSDGGRLLKGPGDGVSDSIPAMIGNKRPARLADGEFVVPARIVSELGNGSTEAGARKLYAMLDRVQAARKKSIGKGKVAKNSRADKLLPA